MIRVLNTTSNVVESIPVGPKPLRVAVICNWGDQCGIATYSRYLCDALRSKVESLKIFAEGDRPLALQDDYDVECCWLRGGSPTGLLKRIHEWNPNFVLIQHEFGIFPKAGEWLKLLAGLEGIPYGVVLHSIYEHQDKAICVAPIRHVICHSEAGKSCLGRLGFAGGVTVVPHGCMDLGDPAELWNSYRTDYTLFQFGFGFVYKGVETALDAIARLRSRPDGKYEEIFFTYLCSEAPHTLNVNNTYYQGLLDRVERLGLVENVAIVRGFQTEQTLHQFLRVKKIAIFPYQSDPANVVYGASGAVRLALANRRPTIASNSPMFADLEGVVPRPADAEGLAAEIDRIFSDGVHRDSLVTKSAEYTQSTTWNEVACKYADLMQKLIDSRDRVRFIKTV